MYRFTFYLTLKHKGYLKHKLKLNIHQTNVVNLLQLKGPVLPSGHQQQAPPLYFHHTKGRFISQGLQQSAVGSRLCTFPCSRSWWKVKMAVQCKDSHRPTWNEKVTKKRVQSHTIPIQIQLVCLLKVLFLSIKSYLFLDLQFVQLIF